MFGSLFEKAVGDGVKSGVTKALQSEKVQSKFYAAFDRVVLEDRQRTSEALKNHKIPKWLANALRDAGLKIIKKEEGTAPGENGPC
ncbi:MAG: hypothetical protein ACR2PW_04700 [Gammaproteobacteria bacterium]